MPDSRISEERDQEDLDVLATAGMVRVPCPPALGDLPPDAAEGVGGGEPELVSPSQTHQGTTIYGGQVPPRAGQCLL